MSRHIKYLFNKYPFVSNSIIYGSLYVTAECSQQIVTKKILVCTIKRFFSLLTHNRVQQRRQRQQKIQQYLFKSVSVIKARCLTRTLSRPYTICKILFILFDQLIILFRFK